MKSTCVSRHILLMMSVFVAFLVFSMGGTNAFAGESEGASGSNDFVALEGNPTDLSFVYMGEKSISLGDEQYVVVGFAAEVGQPKLRVVDEKSGAFQVVDPVKFVDGAALFALPGTEASTYRVSSVTYLLPSFGSDARYEVSLSGDSLNSTEGTFTVLSEGEGSGEGGISIQAYSLADDSGYVEQDLGTVMALSSAGDINGDGRFTVILDPGHGGSDPGACANGLRESDLTLKIARYCRDELKRYAHTDVYMTRDGDYDVELTSRSDFAKSVSADFFISFHINSGGGEGAEVWIPAVSNWYPAYHGVGEDIAKIMLDKFEALGLVDRGTKWDYYELNGKLLYYPDGSWADAFAVIRGCRNAGIPAILAEHGFVDNASDAAFLSNEANLKSLGIADAQAIVEHFGLTFPVSLFGFSDVFDDTPHSSEIGWLAAAGISEGFPDGTFAGERGVTRQDMAAFLYRLAGSPAYEPSKYDKTRFSDVDERTPHAKEIWWLASTGISAGFSDGTFGGMRDVTRQDMAAFMRRFESCFYGGASDDFSASSKDKSAFADVDESTPHAQDIWWLAYAGISTGFDDGTFRGRATVARQDMAALFYRLGNLSSYQPSDSDKTRFSDVDDSTPHAQDIWWLASEGVSQGFSDGTFGGPLAVTRQDMAAFLYRLAGSPIYTPSAADRARFSDVGDSTPHAKEIWWLASIGISSGFPDGTFGGMKAVARQDMAAFMRRFYERFAQTTQFKNWVVTDRAKLRFLDVDPSAPHAEDIWWLAAMGISTGYEDGTYRGSEPVARQDLAAFLNRLNIRVNRAGSASDYSIMGATSARLEQFVKYYQSSGATYPVSVYSGKGAATIEDFGRIVMEESAAEGVKAEVVFCQAMKETGWLRFGGSVKPDQCNFAGLGAVSSSAAGAVFPDVRTGIRAQVQHLKAYASTDVLVNPLVDGRFNLVPRGCAPTLAALNGRWAVPGSGYGQSIYRMIRSLVLQ